MNKVICKECEKEIDVNVDKHTLIGTYNGDRVMDESYFHFDCFVKWYNHKVSEKAKNSVKTMQDKVQGLMANPKIAGLMSMIGGTDKLKGMLNTDLDVKTDKIDVAKMMADFMGDDPDKMDVGTITPMPKKSVEKVNDDDGKRKNTTRSKPTKKKVQ